MTYPSPTELGMQAIAVASEPQFDFSSTEYRSLHKRSRATAFQGPGWLSELQRQVAPALGTEPATVTVREVETGRLLLVLPLTRSRHNGVSYIEFCDHGLCDYLGAVYDADDAARLLAQPDLAERLAASLPAADVVSLTKLTGEDLVLERLFPNARRASMRMSTYPALVGGTWTEWRNEKLDRSFRRYIDNKRRRLAKTGAHRSQEVRDADEIGRLFDVLRRYRSARFREIKAPDVLDNEAIFAFYRAVAVAGAANGSARTFAIYLDDEPVSVTFGLAHRGTFSFLLSGYDFARHGRLSLGLLGIEDTLRAAVEAGDTVYDFTIGDHGYKQQFGAEAVPLYEWHTALTLRGHVAVFGLQIVRETKRVLKPLVKGGWRRAAPEATAEKQ